MELGKPKSIWYINQYAGGPGLRQAYRAYELAAQFHAKGRPCVVILGSFNDPYVQTEHYPESFYLDGVLFICIRTNKYRGSSMGRLASIGIFTLKLYFIKRKLPPEYQTPSAIIASSVHPFSIFPAKHLARRLGAKLVFEIRDLWPLTLIELLGLSEKSALVRACAFTEKYAVKHSDLITSVLSHVDQYYKDIGLSYKRFAWLPNGYSNMLPPESIDDLSEPAQSALGVVRMWQQQQKIVIVHAGSLGPPNAVDLLIRSVTEGKNAGALDNVTILLIGDGVNRDDISELGKTLMGDEFYHAGQLTKTETQVVIEQCDIGYAGIRSLPNLYKYGLGMNKIPTYMDAKLPVVLPCESCGDAVSESGCGVTGLVETEEDLYGLIKQLADLSEAERRELGEKGNRYLHDVLSYDVIAENYLSVIDQN